MFQTTFTLSRKRRGKIQPLCFPNFAFIAILIVACAPSRSPSIIENMITPLAPTPLPAPISERPQFAPGELVDCIAQNGDTLPALAARFNATVEEIMAANSIIPQDATTMPPGFPMKIPIYYVPLWGTAFQSIPDHAFVNGPAQIGFGTSAFVASTSGWLKNYRVDAGEKMRTSGEAVDYVARNYSISPQLLLALLQYQTGALAQPDIPAGKYMLGFRRVNYESSYLQLIMAANILNDGYYSWRAGKLTEIELLDETYGDPGEARPEERLERLARATRQQWETGAEIIAIYNGVAAADTEVAAKLSEALKGRRKGMGTFALSLKPHLHTGLDTARAAAILQALCLSDIFNELVRHLGWSVESYQAWLAQSLKRELLKETASA